MRKFLIAVGVVVLGALVFTSLVVDEGEVVTLITTDDAGKRHQTQLWIVDVHGDRFLRSSAPVTGWLERVEAHPEVELRQHDDVAAFHAEVVSDPELLVEVNRAMHLKYGFVDRLYSNVYDRSRSVLVKLVESNGSPATARRGVHEPR